MIDVMPVNAGIEKIAWQCPKCGEYETIFGGWPNGHLIQHICKKCGHVSVLRVNFQEKLI
jgi:uncharacterized Zn finger protein